LYSLLTLAPLVACGGPTSADVDAPATGIDAPAHVFLDAPGTALGIKHVFFIMMENHSWSSIKGSSSAPYINSLLATAAHTENYKTPPGLHPSEPNYIWLEAGDNLGIKDDKDPAAHHLAITEHLTTQLENAGFTWKAYVEDISGDKCPLKSSGLYGTKHTPQLFFDDVTTNNSDTSAKCIAHIRPYPELTTDLTANHISNYNFITPNLCNDMHGALPTCVRPLVGTIKKGDDWLKVEVPKIMASAAYADHGAIFIAWDEGDEALGQAASDGPLGMIVLSATAKPGYSGAMAYDHSSTVRTMQDIFSLKPYMRGAANATNLSDLFTQFP
jgi:phosphatidylinositol-3-phosphatase